MDTARASSRSASFGGSIRFSMQFRRPVSQPVDGPENGEQVGAITAVLGWAVISTVYPYYIGTQIPVVIAAFAVMRLIGFDRLWKAVILGASVAVVAAMVSAPVTVLVFGCLGSRPEAVTQRRVARRPRHEPQVARLSAASSMILEGCCG